MAVILTTTITKPEGTEFFNVLYPEKIQQMRQHISDNYPSCLSNHPYYDQNNPNVMYNEMVFTNKDALEKYKAEIAAHPLWIERKAYWEQTGITRTFSRKVV